jgi:beta-phosphoglucomutase-like phosphatase (HAD superfamily)
LISQKTRTGIEVGGYTPPTLLPSGRIIVDMDATLYYAPFAEACRVLHGADCTENRSIETWEWHKMAGLTDKQFYEAVNFVHDRQMVYPPFDAVPQTLQQAEEKGFEIIVTSQREPRHSKAVDLWLAEHEIPAHKTYIRQESKVSLFRPGDIIIDDNPTYILAGLRAGCPVISLRYPYNEPMAVYGATLVKDWYDVMRTLWRYY